MNEKKNINARTGLYFGSSEAKCFPKMVVCGLSFRCNARCIHCPNATTGFTATLKGNDQLMDWKTLYLVADECAQYSHSIIRVSSAGEILVHPESIQMIEYMLKVKEDHNVVLTTNGLLLTLDKAKRLLAAGIRAIEFSIDAHRQETYEKIRIGLDFDKVKNNLDRLVAERDRKGYDTKIMVSIIEQPVNETEIEEIRRYWEAHVDEVLIRRLLTFKGIIPRRDKYPTLLENGAPCPFLWDRVLVDAVGDVRGCVSDLYNISRLGNVHEKSITSLWQGEPLNSWRKLHLEGQPYKALPCRGCQDMEYKSWNYNYFTALQKRNKKEYQPDES